MIISKAGLVLIDRSGLKRRTRPADGSSDPSNSASKNRPNTDYSERDFRGVRNDSRPIRTGESSTENGSGAVKFCLKQEQKHSEARRRRVVRGGRKSSAEKQGSAPPSLWVHSSTAAMMNFRWTRLFLREQSGAALWLDEAAAPYLGDYWSEVQTNIPPQSVWQDVLNSVDPQDALIIFIYLTELIKIAQNSDVCNQMVFFICLFSNKDFILKIKT